MPTLGRSRSSHPPYSLGFHTSEVATAERAAEEVVKISFDDEKTGKKVAAGQSDPQKYPGEEVWPINFRGDDVKSLLRAASQPHVGDSRESLRTSKHQHGVRLMSEASSVLEKLVYADVDSMLEQCEKEAFFKTSFSLNIADGGHRLLYSKAGHLRKAWHRICLAAHSDDHYHSPWLRCPHKP